MRLFNYSLSTIGLIGSTMLGSLLIGNAPGQAIPETQLVAKLQAIPVYVITDEQGTIVEARASGQKKNQPQQVSAGVFFSTKDAQDFIDKNLKPQQPDLAKAVKVTPVSLGEIYRRQQANKNKPQELNYVYVPTSMQARAALTILNQSGKKVDRLDGLPVFIATIKSKAGKDEYLTFERNRQEIVPVFFSESTLQSVIKKVYPKLTGQAKVQVIEFSYLLGYMATKTDPVISAFEFNPNMEDK